tara:strand:+ start:19088 stop:19474 length:387 start_codon:yes stop_codon:yes gene_type:complete
MEYKQVLVHTGATVTSSFGDCEGYLVILEGKDPEDMETIYSFYPVEVDHFKDDDKDDKRIVLMGKGCVDRGDGKMDRKEYAPEGTAETVEDAEKALHEKAMQKGEYLSQRLEERVLPVVDGTKFAKKE